MDEPETWSSIPAGPPGPDRKIPGRSEALIERYGPRLRYSCARSSASGRDPEDLLQDVWIDVFRKIHRLRSAASFRSWLYRSPATGRSGSCDGLRKLPRSIESIPAEPEAAPEPEFTAEDAARIHAGLERIGWSTGSPVDAFFWRT